METGSSCKIFSVGASYCGIVIDSCFVLTADVDDALIKFKLSHIPDVDFSINRMFPVDLSVIEFHAKEVFPPYVPTAPI